METSYIFTVHIQGMMPVTDTILVSGHDYFHAGNKAAAMFNINMDRVLFKKKNGLYRISNGELVHVCDILSKGELAARKMANRIINKF